MKKTSMQIPENNWQQIELFRKHLISYGKILALILAALYPFNQALYQLLAKPLQIGPSHVIIATKVISPFTIPLKLCIISSFVLSMPVLLWHFWRFLSPALTKTEQKILRYLLIFGGCLFLLGLAFCFIYVLPSTIKVFQSLTPKNVVYMPDMDAYLDFSLALLTAFGLGFELPVLLITLIKFNFITEADLVKRRKEVVVACFVIGMLLTPPDVTAQILLALPLWGLFELSILLARII